MKHDSSGTDAPLPADVLAALTERGIEVRDEVGLRHELERHLPGYSLYRLMPAAVKRWKARYRIMYGATYLDGQSVAEVYARALLATFPQDGTKKPLTAPEDAAPQQASDT